MSYTLVTSPTPEEVQDIILAARQARAHVFRGWIHAAFQWLAHPHLGHRTA